jgi:hypothetical protein
MLGSLPFSGKSVTINFLLARLLTYSFISTSHRKEQLLSDAAQQASLLVKHAPKLSSLLFDDDNPLGENIMCHFSRLSHSVPSSDVDLLEAPPAHVVSRLIISRIGPWSA